MSYFTRVFCRSDKPITLSEITEYADEVWYGDEPLRFDPPSAPADEDWTTLTVTYQQDKRPVIFHHDVNNALVREEVAEVIASHFSAASRRKKYQPLIDRLRATHQIVAIEVSAGALTEDASELVDTVAGHLTETYQGVLYEPDIVFYDETLEIACAL